MPRVPYVPRTFDSRGQSRYADLVRYSGAQEADAIRQQGNISAQMWSGLGQVLGSTFSDLGRLSEGQRRERVAEGKKKAEGDMLNMVSTLPPEQAAKELRSAGYLERADEAEKRGKDARTETLNMAFRRISTQSTLLGKSAQLLKEVQQRPELWPEVRPILVDAAAAIHPNLVNEIPEPFEPERIKAMMQFASDAKLTADTVANATKQAQTAYKLEQDGRESLDAWRKSVGTALSVAKTPEDWDQLRKQFAAFPTAMQVVDTLGSFSPESVSKAQEWSGKKPEAGFSLAPGATRYDAEGNVLTKAPERPERESPPLSRTQKNQALTRYQNRLDDIEEGFRKELDKIDTTLRGLKPSDFPDDAEDAKTLIAAKDTLTERLSRDKQRAQDTYYQEIEYDPTSDPRGARPLQPAPAPPPRGPARAGRGGPPPGAPGSAPIGASPAAAAPPMPREGERRTVNGVLAEWRTIDGQSGWVKVP